MDKYERARDRIADRLWIVDAERGLVFNEHGRQIGSRTSSGYIFLTMAPLVGRSNQNVYAHRVIWESVHGPIPTGLQVNHINAIKHDNRIANLELVTASGNVQHAVDMGLIPYLHGDLSPNAKVTWEDVAQIRRRAAEGETQQSIADEFCLSRQQVGKIVRGERWRGAA